MDLMEMQDEGGDTIQMDKLKEEYQAVANDLSSVFLWMQRELLASQTLTDLAKNNRREEEDSSRRKKKTKKTKTTPPPSPAGGSSGEEEDMVTSSGDEKKDSKDVWDKYIPPSLSTITTLETTNKTERNVMALPSSPPSRPIPGDEMMDIAHALEDLHCENKKRFTVTNSSSTCNELLLGPQPKKRRRRRHEIARNFRCSVTSCSKSYGSEGALKTHIRLKHLENSEGKKKERECMGWLPPSAGIGGPILLPPPNSNQTKPLAGGGEWEREMVPIYIKQQGFQLHRNENTLPSISSMIHQTPAIPLPHSTAHREHNNSFVYPTHMFPNGMLRT